LWTLNRPKISIFWKNIKLQIFYILNAFYVCLIIPYYYKKNPHKKVCMLWKSRAPSCETNNVWQSINSTLKVLCSNQNSKSKDPMVQFRFLNIYINLKHNLPLKGHHIGIYNKKCSFEHDLTWFLAHCFKNWPFFFVTIFQPKLLDLGFFLLMLCSIESL
jgi:hypothetical protein